MALEIKEHPKYKGVFTSKDGKVFRVKEFSPFPDSDGYMRIGFDDGKAQRQATVYRLIMECWEGLSDLLVNHIDFNRANNDLENLEFVTPKQNSEHSNKAHRLFSGTQKIDAEKALAIYTVAPFMCLKKASKEWGMATQSLRNTAIGKTLPKLHKEIFPNGSPPIFKAKDKGFRNKEVVAMSQSENDLHKIAAKFNIGVSRVRQILLSHKRKELFSDEFSKWI